MGSLLPFHSVWATGRGEGYQWSVDKGSRAARVMVPTQGLDGAEPGGGLKEMLKGPIGMATMPRYKAEQGEWWKEAGRAAWPWGKGGRK